MTDIRTEAELRHPVDRVWRALTDQQLLEKWLGATDLLPEDGAPFELRPIGLPGLDGEVSGAVVEVDEPRRLVLRWRENGVRVLVTFELAETEQGCRLTVRQSGTDGHWTTEQDEQRQQGFQQLLTGPLPAVLDWLAFREVDFTSETEMDEESDGTAGDTDPWAGTPVAAEPERRRRRLTAGLIAAAIVLGGAMVVFAVLRPHGSTTTAAPQPTGTESGSPAAGGAAPPTAPGAVAAMSGAPRATATGSASASPSATPTAVTTPVPPTPGAPAAGDAPPPGQPNLDARYNRASTELLGYTGEIVLSNSGTAEAAQWSVTVVLHGGATVIDASGANADQKGRTVTFTGSAVPAGGSARFTFRVNAALSERQPESCRVGDRACAGV
ncbi:SRPBCC domain-containing protein [Micromonospora sp. NPDC049523]|uniref:SRPBCC domain-containing protein n=1 Tax=Micromonospora sp. NPDC049523 TaxID=3155921 RepID=UPI0034134584